MTKKQKIYAGIALSSFVAWGAAGWLSVTVPGGFTILALAVLGQWLGLAAKAYWESK